jgi:hypothetical protein
VRRRIWAKPGGHSPGSLIQALAQQVVVTRHSDFPHVGKVFEIFLGDLIPGLPLLFSDFQVVRQLAFHCGDEVAA